jgi:glucose/arabinose dehydrogenase
VSVNILDNDAAASEFSFSQSGYDIKEDSGPATITVRRSGNTSGTATVNYSTANGTALAGSDYTASTGTISFANGEISKTFTVGITNDALGERNETVNLQLSAPTGGIIGAQRTAVLNILDSDPGSFTRETTITGLTTPTAMEWTPNGQYMFIAEQNGLVKVATTSNNQIQATPFIDLRDQVNGVRDRGLLGMTLDPQFNSGRPYVYLLFTYDPPEAGDTTRPGYSNEFSGKDQAGNRPSRLIRVEAELVNGVYQAKAGSQIVLLGQNSNFANTRGFDSNSTLVANANIPASGYVRDANGNNTIDTIQSYIAGDSESHSIGDVKFGADGKLYVSTGDASSYNFADPRAVRVQDIDNLSGKILRIDPDTGAGLADNPFYNTTTGTALDAKYNNNTASNRSKVFNLGLRNPFRMTFDPKTNLPVVGDVGWYSWEEINTGRGKNFGWTAYEGGLDNTGAPINIRTPNYQSLPEVIPFYPGGSKAINATAPVFAFQHQAGNGDAIIMGEYYTGTTFPTFYDNALFYANASRGTVSTVFFDQTGKVTGTQLFADNFQGITQLNVGPDGSLYYVNLGIPIGGGTGTGSIGRWRPTTGTAPNAPANSAPAKFVPGLFQAL